MTQIESVRRFGVVAAVAVSLLGGACTRRVEPTPTAATQTPPAEKSTAQTAIDGFTGRAALDANLRARTTISNVNARHTADTEEAETF